MFWSPLKISPKRFVGIDIGTSSIKVIELASVGERIKLENYGEISANAFFEKPFRSLEKNTLALSNKEIAQAIKVVLREAQIETKEAIFSIPDFSSFFTSFKLPPMTKEEISAAVRFEARQHIPLPLSEVVLDWSVIEGKTSEKDQKTGPEILLVAVPHEVINHYEDIAQLAQIKILALEAEVFGLARALIKDKKGVVGIVDIGAQTSTINIVDNGTMKVSHSFDASSNELTRVLAKALNIDYNEAEGMKKRHGMGSLETNVAKAMQPILDLMLSELTKVNREFQVASGREVEGYIISGGTALLPGLKEYFADYLKKPVEIGNPLANIFYPPVLEETMKEIGSSYTVAIGMALHGFDTKYPLTK